MPDATVTPLFKNHKVVVSRIEVPAGGTIPPHSHTRDYVVLPHVDGRIKKTTISAGNVVKEEDIDLSPSQPYWITAPGPGVQTTSVNTGTGPVIFSKIELV
jgi:hypothetical protein